MKFRIGDKVRILDGRKIGLVPGIYWERDDTPRIGLESFIIGGIIYLLENFAID